MTEINNLRQLLVHQLHELHTFQRQMARLGPMLADLARNKELKSQFKKFGKESNAHAERIEESLARFQETPLQEEDQAVAGLISEADRLVILTKDEGVRDAALALIGHKLKLFEMAGYEAAKAQASTQGTSDLEKYLRKSLEDGVDTGQRFLLILVNKLNGGTLEAV